MFATANSAATAACSPGRGPVLDGNVHGAERGESGGVDEPHVPGVDILATGGSTKARGQKDQPDGDGNDDRADEPARESDGAPPTPPAVPPATSQPRKRSAGARTSSEATTSTTEASVE